MSSIETLKMPPAEDNEEHQCFPHVTTRLVHTPSLRPGIASTSPNDLRRLGRLGSCSHRWLRMSWLEGSSSSPTAQIQIWLYRVGASRAPPKCSRVSGWTASQPSREAVIAEARDQFGVLSFCLCFLSCDLMQSSTNYLCTGFTTFG